MSPMYYSVNLMYRSERGDSQSPLWEERIILVSAIDEDEAKDKAEKHARENESEFTAADGVNIKWVFYQIERVFPIDGDIEDGVELFSRFLRQSEAESLLTPFNDN